MKIIVKIIGYVVGVIFILAGVSGLFVYETGKIAGIFYAIAGVSILPLVFSKLKSKTKFALVISMASFLLFTILGGLLAPLPDIPTNGSEKNITGGEKPDTQGSTNTEMIADHIPTKDQNDLTPINDKTPAQPNNEPTFFAEEDSLSLVKKTLGNDGKTIEEIYKKEISIPAVTGFGWAVVKNPKGDGLFVGYKTELSGNESLPVWWVKDKATIYWVNGKASSRTSKTLQQTPYNASGMSVSEIYTLMLSQNYSE